MARDPGSGPGSGVGPAQIVDLGQQHFLELKGIKEGIKGARLEFLQYPKHRF